MSKKKQNKADELAVITNPDALLEKTSSFLNDKKIRNRLYVIVVVLVLIVGGTVGYYSYVTTQNSIAQEELFQAQIYFEKDSLNLALEGDGNSYGFLEIIDEFPLTKAANLSHFYAGVSYLKLGQFSNAISHLTEFKASDFLVQARAYSLIGDAYLELDDFEEAIEYYTRATEYEPNESFTPVYLKKLAIAYEQNGDLSDAVETYGVIKEAYPNSSLISDAIKQKARLEALVQ